MTKKSNRDRLVIMSDIIDSTMNERNKFTNIMQNCLMSYDMAKNYLNLMVEKGIISKSINEYGESIFNPTSKGLEFRRLVQDVEDMLK